MLVLGAGLAIARAIYLNSLLPVHLRTRPPPRSTSWSGSSRPRFAPTLLVAGLIVAAGILHRAVRGGGDPLGAFFRPQLTAPQRRIRRPVHQPRRHLDLRAPARAAYCGGGAGRPDLRLLGPPDRRRGYRDRGPAASGTRPHRADRQAPSAACASAPCTWRVTCGPHNHDKAPMPSLARAARERLRPGTPQRSGGAPSPSWQGSGRGTGSSNLPGREAGDSARCQAPPGPVSEGD
jgi:hypothetical protein